MDRRRLALAAAGWLGTAVAATTAGVALIGLLGGTLTGPAGGPLSEEQVRRMLAQPAGTPRGVPSAPVSGPAPGPGTLISTEGGTLVARCSGGMVTLGSLTPAQGYAVDDVDAGPVARARAEFETGDTEIRVEVRCDASGKPAHTIRRDTE
ncbi:hypothetical protein DP939_39075 [Spongiactinospora rosea]|uniref:Septum formation initiator n=1 Tax=Spongiactinospora rosea TaxID=2248750 RepID=A0A366LLS7_9ACTN|nr:hypothetical protein [Spongiactinospora rosea]RBQ14777.1 hypothetical protein DP939_39075 [Spongiactinospora rosea]